MFPWDDAEVNSIDRVMNIFHDNVCWEADMSEFDDSVMYRTGCPTGYLPRDVHKSKRFEGIPTEKDKVKFGSYVDECMDFCNKEDLPLEFWTIAQDIAFIDKKTFVNRSIPDFMAVPGVKHRSQKRKDRLIKGLIELYDTCASKLSISQNEQN